MFIPPQKKPATVIVFSHDFCFKIVRSDNVRAKSLEDGENFTPGFPGHKQNQLFW